MRTESPPYFSRFIRLIALLSLISAMLPSVPWATDAPLPEFSDETLPNGLRLLIAEQHQQPAVLIRLLIPVGIRDEPPERAGMLSLLAAALSQGTESHPSPAFTQAVGNLGGAFHASARVESTVIGMDLLAADAEAGLSLLAEAIQAPSFPAAAVKRLRRETRASLAASSKSPVAVLGAHVTALLHQDDQRLGKQVSPASIKRIDRDDLVSFHARHFVPGGAVLAVMGDIAPDAIRSAVAKHFGSWRGGAAAERSPNDLQDSPVRQRFVDMPGLRKTHLALCYPGLPAGQPDLPAWRVLNQVLGGGGFTSRLMTALRSEAGQTYDAQSFLRHRTDHGYLVVMTSTGNDTLAEAYATVVAEVGRLAQDGVTEDELAAAKSYFAGAAALSLETPEMVLDHLLDGLAEGYALTDLYAEAARMAAVRLADVNRLAQTHLGSGARWTVLVGDGKAVSPTLDALGGFERVRLRN